MKLLLEGVDGPFSGWPRRVSVLDFEKWRKSIKWKKSRRWYHEARIVVNGKRHAVAHFADARREQHLSFTPVGGTGSVMYTKDGNAFVMLKDVPK